MYYINIKYYITYISNMYYISYIKLNSIQYNKYIYAIKLKRTGYA